jgi:hypothetical protein
VRGEPLNSAAGAPPETWINPLRVRVSLPEGPDTTRVTEYVPFEAYVWLGFLCVDVVPSPKIHCQVVTSPLDWSVNETARGAVPLVGAAAKPAAGARSETDT